MLSPQNGKVPPRRVPNAQRRPREHLTEQEIVRLMEAARTVGRHPNRDATLILLAFCHGLRVSEAVGLRWTQVDLNRGLLHVRRLKNGAPSTHRLSDIEQRALRGLRSENAAAEHVFVSERRTALSAAAVRKMLARAGERAGIGFPVHPQQLRHATGYVLTNKGTDTETLQKFMGHRKIQHTLKYSTLGSAGRVTK
jgi:integrase